MLRHRVWLLGVVLGLSLMLCGAASAWEFNMTGSFTFQYETRGQNGRAGFFGPYDVDAGSGITGVAGTPGFFAPLNGWIGFQLGDLVSGTDAARQTYWMVNNIELRVNPALRIRGQYYIGTWTTPNFTGNSPANNFDLGFGNLVASENYNSAFPGIQRSFSPGYWNTLWLTAELPWGVVALGKRASSFGMGLYYNGEENRSSEKASLLVPYGPFRFRLGVELARRNRTDSDYDPTLTNVTGVGAGSLNPQSAGYFNPFNDKNNGRTWDIGVDFTYRSGDLELGLLWDPVFLHNGGEGIIAAPSRRQSRTYRDRQQNYGVSYVKYNNGRFFWNSELDWYHEIVRQRIGTAGTGLPDRTRQRDLYIENWRWGVETGILCGPSKLTFLYFWSAGPDRRRGQQIDRNGVIVFPGPTAFNANVANSKPGDGLQSTSYSETGVLRPYSYLAVYSYGLGTHINGDTDNGYAEDASILAARLDYAVASNLNVYGSFMWADRVSKSGWGWGFIRPVRFASSFASNTGGQNGAITNAVGNVVVPVGSVEIFRDTVRLGAPSIPDSNLGYEIDSGFDWKLLEGLVVNATFAYWQPGNWFKWACVDKSIPNWAVSPTAVQQVNNPLQWGVNPNRGIDPIWGLELKVTADF